MGFHVYLHCRGPSAWDHIAAKLTVSLMTLADTAASSAAQAVGEKAAEAVTSSALAVQSATDAAAEVVQRDNGWFGFFTGPFETVLKVRSVLFGHCVTMTSRLPTST